ncbi:MAG: DUF4157 domain-containing protein [Myxococcota bacterium]|nr:DUF4157 domain-containing protein [Myxococcota bacterium]
MKKDLSPSVREQHSSQSTEGDRQTDRNPTSNAAKRNPNREGTSSFLEMSHQHFGNQSVLASVSAGGGELSDYIFDGVCSDIAGLGSEVPGSNQALLRRMKNKGEVFDVAALNQGGQALPKDTRARMEAAMNRDFSDVRIHTDGQAANAATQINAFAFTQGNHIYFAAGEWAPGTTKGDRLLAHELTHVVQHQEGRLPTHSTEDVAVSQPSDPVEQEAYTNEKRVLDALQKVDREFAALAAPEANELRPDSDVASHFGDAPSAIQENISRRMGTHIESQQGEAVLHRRENPEGNEEEAMELTPEQLQAIEKAENAQEAPPESEEKKENEEAEKTQEDAEETETKPESSKEEPQREEETKQAGMETETSAPATGAGPQMNADSNEARPVDNIVDHYMKVHWEQSDLIAKTEEFGIYPDAIATETDRWLPSNTPASVRGGANLLVGLGAGLLDATFEAFAKSIPGVGAVAELLYGIKDGWENIADCVKNGDGTAAFFEGLRAVLDTIAGISGNIADLFTYVQDTAHVLAPFTAGISEVIGVPAAGIANAASWISSACATGLAITDLGLTIYYYIQGQEAEAAGNFALQAWYKKRATDGVFRTVGSILQATFAWLSVGTGALVPGQAPSNFAELLVDSGQKFVKNIGGLSKEGAANIEAIFKRFNGPVRSFAVMQGVTNMTAAMGFGDVMRRDDDGFMGAHYIQRQDLATTGTRAAELIGNARSVTVANMNEGWQNLESDKPKWHQEVINKILAPESGVQAFDVMNAALRPSEWIRLMFAGARYILTAIGDGGLEAVAGLAGLAETALTGIAQPFINNMSAWFQENKPYLDEMLVNLNSRLQEQSVSLQTLRDVLNQVQSFIGKVDQLADQGGVIDNAVQPLIDRIAGMRISGDSLGIPGWVPERAYNWAIRGINGTLDRAIGFITSIKDGALRQLDSGIETAQGWAQDRLTYFQESIAAGGELETMLQDELRRVQETTQEVTEAWTAWDGDFSVDFSGAAEWLQQMATQIRDATSTARQNRWKEYVQTGAQQHVDYWKQTHEHEVMENFWPNMPAHELSAIEQARTELVNNLSQIDTPEAQARLQEVNLAYQECVAFRGKQGREALEGLWLAEERLARLALLPLPVVEKEEEV